MSCDDADVAMLLRLSEHALRIHQIDVREVRVIQLILDWSFRRGRVEALIPELSYFRRLAGIDESDARKILSRLMDRGIVQIKELGRDAQRRKLRSYRFRPDAGWWRDAPRMVDVEDMMAAEDELVAVMQDGRDVEGLQRRLFAVEDEDFEDGLSAANRESALQDAAPALAGDAQWKDAAGRGPGAQCEVPAARADGHGPRVAAGTSPPDSPGGLRMGELPINGVMGKLPIVGSMGKLPIEANPAGARARDVLNVQYQNVSNVQNVQNVSGAARNGTRRFADAEKQLVMERIEEMCADTPGYRQHWWVANVRDYPAGLLLEAVGDTEHYLTQHKCREAPGAVLWRYVERLARERGIPRKRRACRPPPS